jgi:hypothetical protein
MKTPDLARLIRLFVIKQWFKSIFSLINSNRPEGMFGEQDPNVKVANQIQTLAWDRYLDLEAEIRELTKDSELAKFCL